MTSPSGICFLGVFRLTHRLYVAGSAATPFLSPWTVMQRTSHLLLPINVSPAQRLPPAHPSPGVPRRSLQKGLGAHVWKLANCTDLECENVPYPPPKSLHCPFSVKSILNSVMISREAIQGMSPLNEMMNQYIWGKGKLWLPLSLPLHVMLTAFCSND